MQPKAKTTRKPKKTFVGRTNLNTTLALLPANQVINHIPYEILEDKKLEEAISRLPTNYSFEIPKTIHQIRSRGAKTVALQMPEGLQMYACTIAEIIEEFTDADTVILGDVTYGACCIDDYTAIALGSDMLVHYGHSCLVPIDSTNIKTLYIFVEIRIDSQHLHDTIRLNIPHHADELARLILATEIDPNVPAGTSFSTLRHLSIEDSAPQSTQLEEIRRKTRLALVSTIQFSSALQNLKNNLSLEITNIHKDDGVSACEKQRTISPQGQYDTFIPRSKPLSPGELLGCTAPTLGQADAILYLGDGRFHLESIMIANPSIPAFRYDPYSKKLTREYYEHKRMRLIRKEAVDRARLYVERSLPHSSQRNQAWGVILGTLGRQGSYMQHKALTRQLEKAPSPLPHVPILLSELSPAKLSLFGEHILTFIQTSCPRLSIDWGDAFAKPLLSPYEACVALNALPYWRTEEDGDGRTSNYRMDFYAADSLWSIARKKGYIFENI